MSPLQIQILLHCHCIVELFHPVSLAYKETIHYFLNEDLIIETKYNDEIIYTTTPRGQAMVEMLISTPLPERVWIDPRTNKVMGE